MVKLTKQRCYELMEIAGDGDAGSRYFDAALLSLIVLNVTFQSRIGEDGKADVDRAVLNRAYSEAAQGAQEGLLVFSEEQNVAADVTGMKAAVVLEGHETHTRTGFVSVDLSQIPGLDPTVVEGIGSQVVEVPVTHAKIFGWYDNEYGSYTNLLGDLTVHVHRQLAPALAESAINLGVI